VSEPESELEIEEVDQKQFESAKALVLFLVKTIKSLLLYPKNNPIPREFKRKLHQDFCNFLDSNEELRLGVKSSQLLYQGKTVHEDKDREEGMAYALHKDGVRELTFVQGLEQEELVHFLEVMELYLKSTDLEEDLVTLLWEKDFNHIKYLVVDDLLDVNVPKAEDIPDDWDFSRLLDSETPLSGEEKLLLEQKEEQRRELLEKLGEFSSKEIEEIHKLLESDDHYHSWDDFFTILGEVLTTEDNFSEYDELMKNIEKILDALINASDLDSASKIMRRLRGFEQATRNSSSQTDLGNQRKVERIKNTIDQAGEEGKIRNLCRVLNEKEMVDLSKVKEYLLSLNSNSIPPILHMLGELKNFSSRKMVCEVLEEVGKDHIGMVGQGVYDSLWYVVRNVAVVLGKIGKEEGVKFLKKIMNHSDMRVKKEVITSLIKISGREAQGFLVSALEDKDNEIRLLVCRGLAQRKEKGALPVLMKIIQSDQFIDLPTEEKRCVLESLAMIGEDEVIPFLKILVDKRRWLRRDKHNETRIFAIRALGFIKTQLAHQTLQELSKKRNKVIRQACQSALRKLDSGFIPEKEPAKTDDIAW